GETAQGVLAGLSEDLAAAVETAAASVVRVEARRGNPSSGIVWTADGHVLTADHTVEREEEIPVGLGDGRTAQGRLVARDPGSDLALLKIEASDLVPAARASDDGVKIGHIVLSIGRPGAAGVMASLGIVSALGGQWRTSRGGQLDRFVRTDATLYPGFSGGPLVDAAGRVVGVNSWTLSQGAGLAIPVGLVAQIADALTQGGVKRAYLGVATQAVALPAAVRAKLGTQQESGVMLVGVEADGPAEKSGLLIGDVLVAINGNTLNTADDLLAQLSGAQTGQQAAVKLIRGGEVRDIPVTLGQRS
ncbi:MAG TPA: trypsin-like peptidase domain-containing protein, partial [Herpetosiphonaceae bacterium]|nr:trypsin-like peptidase domain-containing protein [Herpetosiphonaceae bacterium]